MVADYDYMLGGDDEDGGIPFFEPDTDKGKEIIEWVRHHGVSPDWCFGIRLQGEEAVLRLVRFDVNEEGRWYRVLARNEKGQDRLVFDEHTVPREGFPEIPASEVIRHLSADKASLAKKYSRAQRSLDEIYTLVRKGMG